MPLLLGPSGPLHVPPADSTGGFPLSFAGPSGPPGPPPGGGPPAGGPGDGSGGGGGLQIKSRSQSGRKPPMPPPAGLQIVSGPRPAGSAKRAGFCSGQAQSVVETSWNE